MQDLHKYNKAIIAAVVGLVFLVLEGQGIIKGTTLEQFIQVVLTTAGVYQIANKE